ncbi:hypothetical protein GCM10007362_41480 [Saccharibacillus endophyticus]|uniref:Uncharacterized protein n=1 Tax=Saccharibacillus endophyticus TaxID=2060666 RepID=A0ABQ2A2Q8_9BACL|nr:hypothetical protein GCM10007362_41480 [Saccharibacillus endophyticus]
MLIGKNGYNYLGCVSNPKTRGSSAGCKHIACLRKLTPACIRSIRKGEMYDDSD